MLRSVTYISLLATSFMLGCGKLGLYNAHYKDIVASVGDKHLYGADVDASFPKSTLTLTKEDSIDIRDRIIKNWIKIQTLQAYAQSELNNSKSNLENEIKTKVESYKNQLILYAFENSYIDAKIDTAIEAQEIIAYYRDNLSSFKLTSPLIKGSIARIPSGVRQSKKMENLFLSKNEDDFAEFLEICSKNNYLYLSYNDNWVDLSEVAQFIPFPMNKADELLSKRNFYDVEDDNWRYMLRVDNYLPSGSIVPMEREINNIKKIIIHQRRVDLQNELEDSILKVSYDNGLISIKE